VLAVGLFGEASLVFVVAPNLMRGGSHSGNVAAAGLAAEGLLDILFSDRYPPSLLQEAFVRASGPS